MKLARLVVATLAIVVLGIVTATALNAAMWRLGWPYLGIDWLAFFYDADGENAYDRMWYSAMLQWIATWALGVIALRLLLRQRESAPSVSDSDPS